MVIDTLTVDESARFRDIRLRALRDSPDAFGTTFGQALAWAPSRWRQQLSSFPTFVALREGIDVGLARCARDESEARTAWLISMWVAPAARRQGVGEALVDHAIRWARSNGVTRLLLDVTDDNDRAIGLYARKGFRPTGEVGRFPTPREHITEHRRELWLDQAPGDRTE